jgi:glycosyltransferase XagB
MVNTLSFLEQIDFDHAVIPDPGADHKPEQKVIASDWRQITGATPAKVNSQFHIDSERAFLLSLKWAPSVVRELESEARNAGVGLIQTAIATGVLKASEFYSHLSAALSFAGGNTPYRVHLPAAPSKAWLLIERPVALPAGEEGVVALNGQTFSLETLITLSKRLGSKRRRLKLLTRQELIDSVTRSYGQVLVEKAVAGLLKARPDWSAKTGLALWQSFFGAIAMGFLLGACAIAPQETLTLASLFLSLFFLLAIALRLCAVLSLLFPRKKKLGPPYLSDADLPRYTVFVPLFREVEILPHLARALADLDYPRAKLDRELSRLRLSSLFQGMST